MARKPTYEELEQKVKELEKETVKLRRMDEAERKVSAELESRVKKRTVELTKLNTKLQQESVEQRRIKKELRESEERYRKIFENALVSIREEDCSELISAINDLKSQGIKDFRKYFDEHPEFLQQAQKMIKIKKVNEATLRMYGVKNKEELLGSLDKTLTPESLLVFREELIAIAEEKETFEVENINQNMQGERINVLVKIVYPRLKEKQNTALVSSMDITELKRSEAELKESKEELESKRSSLEEANAALRFLLKQREGDKRDLEERVLFNMKELVLPYMEKLKKSGLNARQISFADVLVSNIHDITSSFANRLSSRFTNLSPMEIQIADLIKQGKTSKEIADIFSLSVRTIETHRRNMRKKTGIKNKKTNLRTHLLYIQ